MAADETRSAATEPFPTTEEGIRALMAERDDLRRQLEGVVVTYGCGHVMVYPADGVYRGLCPVCARIVEANPDA